MFTTARTVVAGGAATTRMPA